MPKVKVKIVNRGPAGLLTSPGGGTEDAEGKGTSTRPRSFNKIAPALKGMIVPIDSLRSDPMNARTHGERNLEAIMDSFAWYGQKHPIVVRKENMTVMSGNGRLAAAKALGWTKIAATIQSMTDVEAAGYGLADNRTAELASWDFEVVAALERLVTEGMGEGAASGWTAEELAAIRGQLTVDAPEDFPEVDESIEVEHVCPKCGYAFSGGEVREVSEATDKGD